MDNPRPQGKTVCLDFDGVLNDYRGWTTEDDLGAPRPGAQAFVAALRARGWELVIVSTRDPGRVQAWLRANGFAETHAQREKPPAVVYLDDRALRFDGRFEGLEERIANFTAYWEEA